MHVLIATSGVLSPGPAVEFTRRLLGQHGRVTLITVIEVPRAFLDILQEDDGRGPLSGEDREQAVARYLAERGAKTVEPVRIALRSARIPSDVRYLEGNDPAAVISAAAAELEVDLVVVGATRPIFDREAWESVSARVMLEAGRPVLVVPAPSPEETTDDSRSRAD